MTVPEEEPEERYKCRIRKTKTGDRVRRCQRNLGYRAALDFVNSFNLTSDDLDII